MSNINGSYGGGHSKTKKKLVDNEAGIVETSGGIPSERQGNEKFITIEVENLEPIPKEVLEKLSHADNNQTPLAEQEAIKDAQIKSESVTLKSDQEMAQEIKDRKQKLQQELRR